MAIRLDAIRDIASVIVDDIDHTLEVVGVCAMGGYVEILLFRNDCPAAPCRVAVDVSRDMPAEELHSIIADAFMRQLALGNVGDADDDLEGFAAESTTVTPITELFERRLALRHVGEADDDYLEGFTAESPTVRSPSRVAPIVFAFREAPVIAALILVMVTGAGLGLYPVLGSKSPLGPGTALGYGPRVMTSSNASRQTPSAALASAVPLTPLSSDTQAETGRSPQSVAPEPVVRPRSVERPISRRRTEPGRTIALGARDASSARKSPAYKGHLRIDSEPQGATVLINQRSVGTTPLELRDYRAASYAVSVQHAGYHRWTSVVVVPANKVTPLRVALQKIAK